MPIAPLVVFDDGVSLAPLNDLRPSFDIRTGAMTTLERLIATMDRPLGALFVPERLEAITRELHPGVPVNELPAGADVVMVINGRCVLADGPYMTFETVGEICTESQTGQLIAGIFEARAALELLRGSFAGKHTGIESQQGALLTKPWHWRTFRDRCIATDLELMAEMRDAVATPSGCIKFGNGTLVIDPSAKVYPGVTFDLEHGAIVIDERATIRPGATLVGPCYIGPDSHVLDKGFIKGNTAIGPFCKVAGEIGGTIIQGYSNKGHDGHLGDAWLGEWVNLGAGTTNSNLLNTYGEVVCRALPESSNERTGEVFLGATIGDHVKTAILTRIMTGSILHMGSMFAQSTSVASTVGGFTWATDAGARPYRFDKFLEVAKAAMARRKIVPTAAYVELMRTRHLAWHAPQ